MRASISPYEGTNLSNRCLLLLLVGFVGACSSDSDEVRSASLDGPDTTGAIIMETAPPPTGERRAWEVEHDPSLRIGQEAGRAWEALHEIRDVLTLRDGRLAVANEGTAEVFIYGHDGRFLKAIGGAGNGPGEFLAPRQLYQLPGDSLLVYDPAARAFSVFTTSGLSFVRRFRRPYPAGVSHALASFVAGVFPDGSLLLGGALEGGGDPSIELHGMEIVPMRSRLYRVTLDGRVINVLGDFITRATQTPVGSLAFGPIGYVVTDGEEFHYGPGYRYEIRTYDMHGNLRRVLLHSAARRPVSAEMMEDRVVQERRNAEGMSPAGRAVYRQRMGRRRFPPVVPAHGAIRAVGGGGLWVQRWAEENARAWDVFAPDGEYQGVVELPEHFTLTEVGEQYVLGIWTDELDVEHVVRHAFAEPS